MQDLPNYAQHEVPIFSLPQEWLWCESWCGNETKAKASRPGEGKEGGTAKLLEMSADGELPCRPRRLTSATIP